jgi:cell wall-associated NlpC family hydrolase
MVLAGCAPGPGPGSGEKGAGIPEALGRSHVVEVAQTALGAPYRYGGDGDPGFDCSGLIRFAYGEVGLSVPRTVARLRDRARSVPLDRARPGDLLFFRLSGKVAHVALYLGDRRFIHAPSRGERVTYGSLEDPFWRRHLVEAGKVF